MCICKYTCEYMWMPNLWHNKTEFYVNYKNHEKIYKHKSGSNKNRTSHTKKIGVHM